MSDFEIKVDTHGLDKKLEDHANKVAPKLKFLLGNITQYGRNRVMMEAPRGKRCQAIRGQGRGGLKASIQAQVDSGAGHIYVDQAIAPYAKWVIDGRGPVKAKKGKALRFCIDGQVVYRRSVGSAEANDFFLKAMPKIQNKTRTEVDSFSRWVKDL